MISQYFTLIGLCLFCSPHSNDKVILTGAMTRSAFTIAIAVIYSAAAAESPPVTFESSCECRDNHAEHRACMCRR